MKTQDQPVESRQHKPLPTGTEPFITPKLIGLVGLLALSAVLGLAFPMIPPRLQFAVMGIFPAIVFAILIFRNPFIGVYLFYLYEYTRPDGYFPAIQPLRVAMLIQLATALAWLTRFLLKGKRSLRWTRLHWLYVGFLAVMAAGVTVAVNNRWAYDYTQVLVSYFAIFVIATDQVKSLKQIKRLVWMLLVVHTFFAARGIPGGGILGEGNSLMGDENDFALAMNAFLPMAFFIFVYTKSRLEKYLSVIVMLTLTLGVIASMSRGGWVGLMAVVAFCIYRSKRKVLSLFIVGMLAVAVVAFAPQEYWSEIQTIQNTHEGTAQTRLDYWKSAVRMWMDNPAVGVGPANGGIRMPEYYVGPLDANTRWGRTFHGTLPQVLAETGTLGLLFYLGMIFMAMYVLIRMARVKPGESYGTSQVLANGLIGGIVGYIATATFLSTAYYPQMWTLLNLTMMLVFCVEARSLESRQQLDSASPETPPIVKPTIPPETNGAGEGER